MKEIEKMVFVPYFRSNYRFMDNYDDNIVESVKTGAIK